MTELFNGTGDHSAAYWYICLSHGMYTFGMYITELFNGTGDHYIHLGSI